METVRFGVVGLGNMGTYHCNYLDQVEHARLAAICDTDPKKLDAAAAKCPGAAKFTRWEEMIASGAVDAVLVATPHYSHPDIAVAAFDKNLHVLCEKPMAVTVSEGRRMIDAAAEHAHLKFGINFQMRTNPALKRVRDLIRGGDLGEIFRISWIVTNWFRTWSYYASGGWRATWAGEGGGVLINQCPHNLDQLYWLTGMMPTRITAVAHLGKTHPIEVEDEVSAIMEYANGATGHFVTTTGEAPGTDRLEIAGDRGKIVAEHGKVHFRMARQSVREFRETSPESFATPECWDVDVPMSKPAATADLTRQMTENFVRAVRTNEPLIAPGAEAINQLELGNAMLMAGVTRQPVDLPLDGGAFDAFFAELAQRHGGRKQLQTRESGAAGTDMSASFGRRA
jgi:predicted dehydrogenase